MKEIDKNSKKKNVMWMVLAVLISALTISGVFRAAKTLSPGEVFGMLKMASPGWMALSVVSMMGFIVMEGLALICLLKNMGHPTTFLQGMAYSSADQFFSAITPSASGGQPAAALLMRGHNVTAGTITAVLFLNLTLYMASSVAVGIFCFVVRPNLFLQLDVVSEGLIIFSMLVLIALGIFFLGMLRKGEMLTSIGVWIIDFLSNKGLVKRREKWIRKIERMRSEHELCADKISGKPMAIAAAFIFNVLQRVAQITVIITVHKALGAPVHVNGSGLDIWVVQAFSQIGSNCVPIPGGMGAADYITLDGLQQIMPREYAYSLQILSRGLSFYVCTMVSCVIFLIGLGAARHRERRSDREQG